MDITEQLICGYLDGELTETEFARLSATLKSNAAALDRFVWMSFIYSQLRERVDPQWQYDDAAAVAATEGQA